MDNKLLVPEIAQWQALNGPEFSIADWLGGVGSMSLAIAYAELFCPTFIEHEGCVLHQQQLNIENFNSWKTASSVTYYSQIEAVINHVHILDLFPRDDIQENITYLQIAHLGKALQRCYQAHLQLAFPDREFDVFFNGDEPDLDLLDYQLSFYQPSNDQRLVEK
ncbi:hypothetical protein VQ643_02665 [Pseudomonas sp. F1_0610]|uniref:hypothetical protein n=1 Tax=Pseudomonas sp. F1_0610 TaxID=3114284 RepID=UPI0039C38AEB